MTSVAKREIRSMQAAGWTVVSYGPWEGLRALLGRRRPVARGVRSETEVVAQLHLPGVARRWSQ